MSGHDNSESNSLWHSFIGGDEEAFTRLYELHAPQMYLYGIRFCDDTAIVEDALHDIFVRIYANRRKLHELKNVKLYLLIAMKNTLLDHVQSKKFRFRLDIASCSYIHDNLQDLEFIMEKDEEYFLQKRLIAEIEKQLSPRQKQAVYYRFFEGLRYNEIGTLMEISMQSARNLVHTAIKKIREMPPVFPAMQHWIEPH